MIELDLHLPPMHSDLQLEPDCRAQVCAPEVRAVKGI
jgi:hypothetical protein